MQQPDLQLMQGCTPQMEVEWMHHKCCCLHPGMGHTPICAPHSLSCLSVRPPAHHTMLAGPLEGCGSGYQPQYRSWQLACGRLGHQRRRTQRSSWNTLRHCARRACHLTVVQHDWNDSWRLMTARSRRHGPSCREPTTKLCGAATSLAGSAGGLPAPSLLHNPLPPFCCGSSSLCSACATKRHVGLPTAQ